MCNCVEQILNGIPSYLLCEDCQRALADAREDWYTEDIANANAELEELSQGS